MKTVKRNVLVVVLMFGTLVNYANNTEFSNILNANKVRVEFKDAKKGHQLKIKDANGVTLHSENVIRKGDLIKTFDFSQLNNGNYTLELNKDFQIIVKSIKIEDGKVFLNDISNKVIYKPVIRNEKNRLMISKISFDKKPLQVDLYYNNEIIYSETVNGNDVLNRVYKLDEAKTGSYRVVVNNNGRNFVNEFKI